MKNPIWSLWIRVKEFADVEGDSFKSQEYNMMAEIYHRGPIACGIAVTEDLYHNYTGGIYYDRTNDTQIGKINGIFCSAITQPRFREVA